MKIFTRILLAGVVALAPRVVADVKLPAIFSDHMVLQAGTQVPVWGWAAAGEEVTVAIAGQTKKVTAGQDGKWLVKLAALTAGAPVTLTVKGQNIITINDVLIGDVWLCSGQSNMAMGVSGAKDFVDNQTKFETNSDSITKSKIDSVTTVFKSESLIYQQENDKLKKYKDNYYKVQ